MSRVEDAVQCFNNGFNCSQAVFAAYCDQLGLNKETALKISSPFGGGIGRMAETCGAVTGAYMLIGLKHGKYLVEDNEGKEKSYSLVREFNERFKELHGTICCRDLLKYDMSDPEELKYIKEHGIWETLCPVFVRDASLIIEDLLNLEQ